MKITEFKYTKKDGTTSERAVYVTAPANKNISGFDVTEIAPEVLVELASELDKLEQEFAQARADLWLKYDLTHNYRAFIPENMTNVTNEYI